MSESLKMVMRGTSTLGDGSLVRVCAAPPAHVRATIWTANMDATCGHVGIVMGGVRQFSAVAVLTGATTSVAVYKHSWLTRVSPSAEDPRVRQQLEACYPRVLLHYFPPTPRGGVAPPQLDVTFDN